MPWSEGVSGGTCLFIGVSWVSEIFKFIIGKLCRVSKASKVSRSHCDPTHFSRRILKDSYPPWHTVQRGKRCHLVWQWEFSQTVPDQNLHALRECGSEEEINPVDKLQAAQAAQAAEDINTFLVVWTKIDNRIQLPKNPQKLLELYHTVKWSIVKLKSWATVTGKVELIFSEEHKRFYIYFIPEFQF
jgi:hypothetical protein